jgi:hypothetical protein
MAPERKREGASRYEAVGKKESLPENGEKGSVLVLLLRKKRWLV